MLLRLTVLLMYLTLCGVFTVTMSLEDGQSASCKSWVEWLFEDGKKVK